MLTTRLRHGRTAARRRLYREVTGALVRLGPAFVKAGQVLATRRDVLPGGLCDELGQLHDSMPPLSRADRAAALAEAYGGDMAATFTRIDPEPVASGSIACVYRAELRCGTDVAVKLRRPGIDSRMSADLTMMRAGAALVARLPMFRGVPVRELMRQLSDSVLGQLDFDRESANLDLLRTNLGALPRVRIPRLLPEASRSSAIVMEFISGLHTDTASTCSPVLRRSFAASTMTIVYRMLFLDGFVHCDLHPGNLYFTAGGHVVVLDAGFSARLDDRVRRLFANFFLNMAIGHGTRCAEIVIESSLGVGPHADVAGFTRGLTDLVTRTHGLSAREFSLIAFAVELFDLQRAHGIAAAPEFVFPLLALLVIEGTIRDLDPDIDFQELAKPILNKAVFGR